MHEITKYYREGFQQAITRRKRFSGRRIGSELKFPFVKNNGCAAHKVDVESLWEYLGEHGWIVLTDPVTGRRIGAELPGEFNNTVARSETGHCLIEFSLAHAGTLHELQKTYDDLRSVLSDFSEATETWLLSFGMHPVEKPGKHLMTGKSRNIFWEKMFGSNRIVPPDEGSDVHLFALSAAHQVHIDLDLEESVKAVNVLNGFAGAQIALTANSNIWRNGVADRAQCLGELFWDWWLGDERDRAGVPERRFDSLDDYADCIGGYSPVFVRRHDRVIGVPGYETFKEYYRGEGMKAGIDADGCRVNITPMKEDISLHNTFFWHDARISRYFTVENRLNDQQPYGEMIVVPALTLGLIENLDEAHEYVSQFDWGTIRAMRDNAIHNGLDASVDGTAAIDQAKEMLMIAERGLARRGSGEQKYLEPLRRRIEQKRNPASEAAELFRREGLEQFIREVRIGSVS
jgi:gamma-glutamylcysteine synthetase